MKKVIRIFGTERSGSTILDLLIGNDNQSISLGEVHFWFRPYIPEHYTFKCTCGDVACEYLKNIKKLSENKLYTSTFIEYEKKLIVDSSKNFVWYQDTFKQNMNEKDIEFYNIVIYKEPHKYAYSKYKRNEFKGWESRYINYYTTAFNYVNDFVTINFDDLMKDPQGIIEKIYDLVELKLENRNITKISSPYHIFFGSGTVRSSIFSKKSISADLEKEDFYNNLKFSYKRSLHDVVKNLKLNDISTKEHLALHTKLNKSLSHYKLSLKYRLMQTWLAKLIFKFKIINLTPKKIVKEI